MVNSNTQSQLFSEEPLKAIVTYNLWKTQKEMPTKVRWAQCGLTRLPS